MPKLTFNNKKEALQNALRSFGFSEKYFIQNADARLGHKFAIATKTETGGINIHSNFMTYDEMNCYLFGYYNALNKPLN